MLLKKCHLELFKAWLDKEGVAYRPGKGEYQVLQVFTPTDGFQVLFIKKGYEEYYTHNEKLQPTITRFYNEQETA